MKFDPNDPQLTAYVLNELNDRDRASVEKLIAENPEAARFVEDLKATTGLLQSALADEPAIGLDKERLEAIAEQVARKPAGKRVVFPWRGFAGFAAAAAALMFAVLGIQMYHQRPATTEERINMRMLPAEADFKPDAIVELEELEMNVGDERGGLVPDLQFDQNELSAGVDKKSEVSSSSESSLAMDVDSMVASASPPIPQSIMSPLVMKGLYSGRAAGGRLSESGSQPLYGPSLDDFDVIRENIFQRVGDHPLSTFSIDVDTASYSVVRKMLSEGFAPPKDAVRIEELINYFPYDYAAPVDGRPFAAHLEAAPCPWKPEHHLVRIAIKGKEIDRSERPALNLVYLLDVSGSMNDPNKLPLLKRSLQALVNQLDARDRVAIVVYAGAAGLVLPSTSGENGQAILDAIERLEAGGSTAGGAGIELAYQMARENFRSNAVNRVILCTDGDFNVGTIQRGDLESLIEREAKSGVFLTVLGFGMGNYKDSTLELLSNKGNGNYAYIDDFSEARKVLVDQMLGTMVTIAKDVKIQVEFNPAVVAGYRLIGYENRMLKKEDFNNDKVDAGEIGAGHTVTALYELIPVGQPFPDVPEVDALKYQVPASPAEGTTEALTVKMRYKEPDGDTSSKLEFPLTADELRRNDPSLDFRFASAVAGFGMLLRESEQRGSISFDQVITLAGTALGEDRLGYRAEFVKLVRNAQALKNPRE
jgi:Ca-activated chloride channel family protein